MKCHACNNDMGNDDKVCPHCGASLKKKSIVMIILKNLDAFLAVVCLCVMVGVVLFQILARNLFHTGMEGADVLVRHLVLWVVFLGASVATREDRHIHIDLLPRFLSPKLKQLSGVLVALFSISVAGVLSYASFYFVMMEKDSGVVIPSMGLPIWVVEFVIPAGYAVIAVHFAVNSVLKFAETLKS